MALLVPHTHQKPHYPKLSTFPQRKEVLFVAIIFPIGADWQKKKDFGVPQEGNCKRQILKFISHYRA